MKLHRLALVLLLTTVAVIPAASAATPSRIITIESTKVSDSGVSISVGDTIRWTNADSKVHQIVPDDGRSFVPSPTLKPGEAYDLTFQNVGTFMYHDSYNSKITGAIKVSAKPASPAKASISLTASQTQVKYGDKTLPQITLSGQVSNNATGETVQLTYQPYGQSLSVSQSQTTGVSGGFSFSLARPSLQTTYTVTWRGASQSATVQVSPAVSLYRWNGLRVRIWIGRSMIGIPIQIQRLVGPGQWVTQTTVTVNTGVATRVPLRLLHLPNGRSQLRAWLPAGTVGPDFVTGFSRVIVWGS